MPGLVLFARKWSFGSDDLFFPALYLLVGHLLWTAVTLTLIFAPSAAVHKALLLFSINEYLSGLGILWIGCVIAELAVAWLSTQGTILDTRCRSIMPYLIYVRLGMLLIQLAWNIIGILWISLNISSLNLPYFTIIFGLIFFDWLLMVLIFVGPSSYGCIDPRVVFGVRNSSNASGDDTRNLLYMQIKPLRTRQKHTVCCNYENGELHSLVDIASLLQRLLSDLELISSDAVAGLVLLRRYQQLQQKLIVSEPSHEVYQFLSGTPITPSTKFLSLKNRDMLHDYKRLVFYASYVKFASDYRKLKTSSRSSRKSQCCTCCVGVDPGQQSQGCPCSIAALKTLKNPKNAELVFASCHLNNGSGINGVGFFIEVNHLAQKIVVCIHSHPCLQDALLEIGNSDVTAVPLGIPENRWLVHKQFLLAASQIASCIKNNSLICSALCKNLIISETIQSMRVRGLVSILILIIIDEDAGFEIGAFILPATSSKQEKGTADYQVVIVGHSLAGGVAVLVSILLQNSYPSLHCYAYCPPSGLVNFECLEGTRSFITSIVVGTDCISRLGCHQILLLKRKLMQLLHASTASKWKIISQSWSSCCCRQAVSRDLPNVIVGQPFPSPKCNDFCCSSIKSPCATPELFIAGNVVHVVRSHPKKDARLCSKAGTVYQAVLAQNSHFNDLLVSPTMFNDHSPAVLLEALNKLSTHVCPAKPGRRRPQNSTLNHHNPAVITTPTNQPADFESTFAAANAPVQMAQSHGIATAVTTRGLPPSFRDRPCDPAVQALKRSFQLEVRPGGGALRGDEWSQAVYRAPLASPETMSETSSLASYGSGSVRGLSSAGSVTSATYRRLALNQAMRMDTICQSPLCRSSTPPPNNQIERTGSLRHSTDGCCRRIDSSTLDKRGEIMTSSQASSPGASNRTAEGYQATEDSGSAASLSPTTSLPFCHTIAEVHHNVDSPTSAGQLMPVPELPVAPDVALENTSVSGELMAGDLAPDSSMVLVLPGASINSEVASTTGTDDGCQQYLYDSYAGHYSPAGRGYPHGFNACASPSCTLKSDTKTSVDVSKRHSTNDQSDDFGTSRKKDGPVYGHLVLTSDGEENSFVSLAENSAVSWEATPTDTDKTILTEELLLNAKDSNAQTFAGAESASYSGSRYCSV